MDSKVKGSHEAWNEVWTNQSEKDLLNPMYTESEPNTIFQFWQKGYADDLLKLIKNRNYQTFCELGSGRGTTTMYLAKAGYEDLTMIDLAKQGFEVAEYSFKKHKLKLPKMLLRDVEKTDLPAESFDCIYNIGLLEHFENPKLVLDEAFRLLTPGGLIFMPIVPSQPLYKSLLVRMLFNPVSLGKLLIKRIMGYKAKKSKIYRSAYRRKLYAEVCSDIGYKNVKCIPYNPYWKVNADGVIENKITLPLYKRHQRMFQKEDDLRFSTSALFDQCFLLTAEK